MVLIDFMRMFISSLLRVYELLFIVRAILSWFPTANLGGFMEILYNLTEPVLAPIRAVLQKIPFLQGVPLDFSILVAYLLIDVIRSLVF